MNTLAQDLRYALRTLRKNPGFFIVIVLSLGIGIGANTAIFSVVEALLLRPLHYPQPERLASIWLRSPGIGIFRDWVSPAQYLHIQNESHSFDEMGIAHLRSMTLSGLEQPERVDEMLTSSSLLHMLGAKPLLGRLLLPRDDKPGKPAVAILSYRLWGRLFHSDSQIVGKTITVMGHQEVVQYTIVGVLRPEFLLDSKTMPAEEPIDRADLFVPLPIGADAAQEHDENFNVLDA